jgi:riboflavin kinase, archaea type
LSAAQQIQGVIYSDLGVAARFMSLARVQQALLQCLGFAPFPATLNVRPAAKEDEAVWAVIRNDASFFSRMPGHEGSCAARVYKIRIESRAGGARHSAQGAVLLPEVKDYPRDKIEIVAPVRLKDAFGVEDGDRLTLEFLH